MDTFAALQTYLVMDTRIGNLVPIKSASKGMQHGILHLMQSGSMFQQYGYHSRRL